MKKFYNYTVSVYTFGTSTVRGSKVQTKTIKYSDIKVSIYGNSKNYGQTSQATQTDTNGYTIVFDCIYPDIAIGDIVEYNGNDYKIMNTPISHSRANGIIDNYETNMQITTKD